MGEYLNIDTLYALIVDFEVAAKVLQFMLSCIVIYICSVLARKKILTIFGHEVEVSGQKYFKQGYKVSLYSLFVNASAFLLIVFLFIRIFNLDSLVEIGGLWAGILAFMGFTAPVWATDMVAGIIILQSKNFETGQVYYLYERKLYVWIKSISLTEVKCIDLKFGNPILFRPSDFRNLAVKNLSQGISGKSSEILREINIFIDYREDFEDIKTLCYEAFDTMQVDLLAPGFTNYFGSQPQRFLEIAKFGDYAVGYKMFYTINSPFYIFKAERLLNEYLLKGQKEKNIYFSTPDLLEIQKK